MSSEASSEPSARAPARRCIGLWLGLFAGLLLAGPAPAKVFQSQQEALELAFPGAERVERVAFVLTPEQSAEVESLSRAALASRVITFHVAWNGPEPLGYVTIDVHNVRTHPEAVMVVLGPEGGVRSVRILAFHEPLDYLPSQRWYAQFAGKTAADALRVGRDIDAVAGATRSTHAASDSVRRALALYRVLIARPADS